MKINSIVEGLAAGVLLSSFVCAGEIKLAANGPRGATLGLPGGAAELALTKAWGRWGVSSQAWVAEGDKLPPLSVTNAGGWIEVRLTITPGKSEQIRIYRLELDLSGAEGWKDADGTRTWLRQGSKWQTVSNLLGAKSPLAEKWIWPVGSGRAVGTDKSYRDADRQCCYTKFDRELPSSPVDPKAAMVDVAAVTRVSAGGKTLALVADNGMAVGFEGAGKLVVYPMGRHPIAGREHVFRVRIYCDNGRPEDVADKWVRSTALPLRVIFAGDSVGATLGGYADMSAGRLHSDFPGQVRTMNVSYGGNKTSDLLAVWQSRVMDYDPNLVVFQLCFNDVGRLQAEQVIANYRKMLDSLLAEPGNRAVILTPLSWDKDVDGGKNEKLQNESYIPALRKMAEGYEADPKTQGRMILVDISAAMVKARLAKGNPDYKLMQYGCHPGTEGHHVIFDAMWPDLKRTAEATLKDREEKR